MSCLNHGSGSIRVSQQHIQCLEVRKYSMTKEESLSRTEELVTIGTEFLMWKSYMLTAFPMTGRHVKQVDYNG